MKKATGKKTREPSRASLREMPEVNFDKTKVRRNPYGLRIAREGISINAGRGRPRKGTETRPDRSSPTTAGEMRMGTTGAIAILVEVGQEAAHRRLGIAAAPPFGGG